MRTTNQIQCMENNGNHTEITNGTNDNNSQHGSKLSGNLNINNNNNSPNNNNQTPHSIDNNPSTLSTTTTTIIFTTNSRVNRNSISEEPIRQQQSQRNTYQNTPTNYSPSNQRQQIMVSVTKENLLKK